MNFNFQQIFEPDLIAEINSLDEINIGEGEIILKEKSFIKEIPLILEGKIKVRKTDEKGKEIVLYHIESGESCILSITSCLNEKQSNAEAVTEGNTRIVVVPSNLVREWMDKYKSWRKFILQLYYSRFDELLNLVDSMAFKQTDIRLYQKLKELQQSFGDQVAITHQQLANEIGTVREVISRLLKQLENEGVIKLERGIIHFFRPM